jgi:6-methylsalicylic acid synthase
MLHHVRWHPVQWREHDRPSAVVVVGGDTETRDFVSRDLTAADVPHVLHGNPAQIEADLDSDAVVLVLPRDRDAPLKSVDVVARTLKHVVDRGISARVWVLTRRVHEGTNVRHAPLWGLARVASAEHPNVFGGVLDIAEATLPVGALASLHGHPVVVMRDGVAQVARLAFAERGTQPPMECSAGGTYLITGGTGALGLRMAQRLADIGARRLVLVSRSGMPDRADWSEADSELIRGVTALEERGVSVHVVAIDIAAPGAPDVLRATAASRCMRCSRRSSWTGWCCSRRAATSRASPARVPTRARIPTST